ncbi:saccharopine dehydrogenase related protein [Lactobacillus sp. 3B(2020)]|uniref:saccharopine dehydrogenase related protein n=1 Tax=Lactobacillus sp. 3B(2020) TaxID=2695882 RepID=UPI0015DFC0BD|nr:saccharopine dehydrogenase related protein [Lactobacillus sp. 3B(2020)]QLL70875.1 saccharopine dehydrogenase related protein [Lactobacillus sp. 3B(2020)]
MVEIKLIDESVTGLGEQIGSLVECKPINNWKINFSPDLVLGWIPNFDTPDLGVEKLVEWVDQASAKIQKIVMLAPAGTADDATVDQLATWYGKKGQQLMLDGLYAVKMVDELEFPYTVIRVLPLTKQRITGKIYQEGQSLLGQVTPQDTLVKVFAEALTTDKYLNQSIGVAD